MKVNFKLEFNKEELKAIVGYNATTDTMIDMVTCVKPLDVIEKVKMVLNRDIKRNIVFNDKGVKYNCDVVFNKDRGIIVDVELNIHEQVTIKTMEAYTDIAIYMLPLAQLAKVVYGQMRNRLDILEEDLNDL